VAVTAGLLTRIISNVREGVGACVSAAAVSRWVDGVLLRRSAPLEALVPFITPDARVGVSAFELAVFVLQGVMGGFVRSEMCASLD
jgi:hypothetical protein